MNDCNKIQLNMHDFVMGEADEKTSEEIKAHIAVCDECRRIYEAEKLYCDNIGEVAEALKTLPEAKSLSAEVVKQIEQEKQHPLTYTPKRRFSVFSYGSIAAVLLVGVLVFFSYKNGMSDDYMTNAAAPETQISVTSDSAVAEDSVTVTADDGYYTFAGTAEAAPPESEECVDEEAPAETEAIKTKRPVMMMAAPPTSSGSGGASTARNEAAEEKELGTQEVTDTTTAEPQESPAFDAHKSIAAYNYALSDNSLEIVNFQVILHGEDSDFYYENLVKPYATTQDSLMQDASMYCLDITIDELIALLKEHGITDYTVITAEDASVTSPVIICYNHKK